MCAAVCRIGELELIATIASIRVSRLESGKNRNQFQRERERFTFAASRARLLDRNAALQVAASDLKLLFVVV